MEHPTNCNKKGCLIEEKTAILDMALDGVPLGGLNLEEWFLRSSREEGLPFSVGEENYFCYLNVFLAESNLREIFLIRSAPDLRQALLVFAKFAQGLDIITFLEEITHIIEHKSI